MVGVGGFLATFLKISLTLNDEQTPSSRLMDVSYIYIYIYIIVCIFIQSILHLIKCAILSLKVISGGIELLTFPK
jgi:hypothetical protein